MHACSAESEVTYLEGLHEPCIPKPPGTEFTGNFAKKHVLKKQQQQNMCSLFLKEGERKQKSEIRSFHPRSSIPQSLGVTGGPIL